MADEQLEGVFQGKINPWSIGILFFMFVAAVILAIEASPFATKEELNEVQKETMAQGQRIDDLKMVIVDIAKINQKIEDMSDPELPYIPLKKRHKDGQ